jgi:hypothetical protein
MRTSDNGTILTLFTGITWDGVTRADHLPKDVLHQRYRIANAAQQRDWPMLLSLVRLNKGSINAARPGGTDWCAPLHHAASAGAPIEVVLELIELGAWRALVNIDDERPVDLARMHGHDSLTTALEPVYKHTAPIAALVLLQHHFHNLILERGGSFVEEGKIRLPQLPILLELAVPGMWFPLPGMCGGFRYQLEGDDVAPTLLVESWNRVVGGSGKRHEISNAGFQLVAEGFV